MKHRILAQVPLGEGSGSAPRAVSADAAGGVVPGLPTPRETCGQPTRPIPYIVVGSIPRLAVLSHAETGQKTGKQAFPAKMTWCKLRISRPGVAGGGVHPTLSQSYLQACGQVSDQVYAQTYARAYREV